METTYTIQQASRKIGISVRTVRKWIADGLIKAEKPHRSKQWQISVAEVERLRSEHMAELEQKLDRIQKA